MIEEIRIRGLGVIDYAVVEPHAGFTHPHQKAADRRGLGGRGMGYAGPRLQHQASDTADRNVRAHAIFVHYHERAIQHIDLTILDKEHGDAFFHGDGLERWKHRSRLW